MTEEPAIATADTPVESPEGTPEPAPMPRAPSDAAGPFAWGTGRRKTSVARVRISPGSGKFVVNKREVDKFFTLETARQAVRTPLKVTDTTKSMDVYVNVQGGGPSGQAGAVVLGLARALLRANPSYESALRDHNLLTRDPREVERKKYGRRGARRRFQFSKR